MKIILKSLMVAPILFSGIVAAEQSYKPKWNVDIFAGSQQSDNLRWDIQQYDTKSGEIFGVGLSRNVTSRAYVGVEFSRTKNRYSGVQSYLKGTSVMLTARYDLMKRGRFSAYTGLGLGIVRPSYEQFNGQKFKESVKGGQLVLGAQYSISPRAKYFVEARRVDTFEDFNVAGAGNGPNPPGSTAEYKGDSVVVGLRYSF